MYSRILVALLLVGCKSLESEVPTWNKDISPIVYTHCTSCHRPNQAAPFTLTSYNDALKHAQMIKHVTASKFMPPWPADPTYSHFLRENTLDDTAIKLIAKWVDAGSPKGKGTETAMPQLNSDSQLGKPDLTVTLDTNILLPNDNKDHFLIVKIPFETTQKKWVRCAEYVPSNKRLSHHINGHLLVFDSSRNIFEGLRSVDEEHYGNKTAMEMLAIPNEKGEYPAIQTSITNYLPGVVPFIYPKGIGKWKLGDKNAILLNNAHYGGTSVSDTDRPKVNFFLTDLAPTRILEEIQLGTQGISAIEPPLIIPPDTVLKCITKAKITMDISLLTINPHMHLLGRTYLAYAVTPNNDTIPLIRIPSWDFRWQYYYTFPNPLHLPKGTWVVAEGLFDNTLNNPFNPFNPPKLVREPENGNMKTTDEMFQLILTYLPYEEGDEKIDLNVTDLND